MPTNTFKREFESRGITNVYTGTVRSIDNKINQINTDLKTNLSNDPNLNGLSINQSSFALTTKYVNSYNTHIKEFLLEIKNRQKLIEMGGVYLAEFNALQQQARNNDYSYMSQGMREFVEHHGITWDKTGNDRKHDVEEWEINKTGMNSWVKSRTNEVQTDVTKLNDLINKLNQIVQSQGTILKKIIESLESLIRNML